MALVVQKFGGTSVATIDRIKHVAGLIAKTRQAGDTVVVVVSAMSGETDRLVKLAHAITEFPDEREMDMLLSTGERVTIALLAMALRAMGFDARSFTGRQVGIITDSVHTKARIERIAADRIQGADRKSTRLNSSHGYISYAVFCLKKKITTASARFDEVDDATWHNDTDLTLMAAIP